MLGECAPRMIVWDNRVPEVGSRPQKRTSLMENKITEALGVMHGLVGRLLLSPQVHLCLHRPTPHPPDICPPCRAGLPLLQLVASQSPYISSCYSRCVSELMSKFRVPVRALPQAYMAAFLLCPQMGLPWHVCRESELCGLSSFFFFFLLAALCNLQDLSSLVQFTVQSLSHV